MNETFHQGRVILLALVKLDGDRTEVRYRYRPFDHPDFHLPDDRSFGACEVFLDIEGLWTRGVPTDQFEEGCIVLA